MTNDPHSTLPFSGQDSSFLRHSSGEAHGDHVVVADPALLFSGHFERHGDDLWISRQFETQVVERYFGHGDPLPLKASDGHWLSGSTVKAFTHGDHGPQYASTDGTPAQPAAIGRVESVEGNATAVRNGAVVLLHVGDFVYKGDAVATDGHGALAVTFLDGTAFNLSSESKMVLDEMVYSPGGTGNKSLISLVQGSINFVAGDVAHTGDMKVDTPVATMGIRGTAVHVDIGANNGPTHFSVMEEPNGRVGRYVLYDKHEPTKVLGYVGDSHVAYNLHYVAGQVAVEPSTKGQAELAHEHDITKSVFQSFQAGAAHPMQRTMHEGQHPQKHAAAHGSAGVELAAVGNASPVATIHAASQLAHTSNAVHAADVTVLVTDDDTSSAPTLSTLAIVAMADAMAMTSMATVAMARTAASAPVATSEPHAPATAAPVTAPVATSAPVAAAETPAPVPVETPAPTPVVAPVETPAPAPVPVASPVQVPIAAPIALAETLHVNVGETVAALTSLQASGMSVASMSPSAPIPSSPITATPVESSPVASPTAPSGAPAPTAPTTSAAPTPSVSTPAWTTMAAGATIAGVHGSLTVAADGSVQYTAATTTGAAAHASVTDTFTFATTATAGAATTTTITIVVDNPNHAPTIGFTPATVTEAGGTALASATAHAALADLDGDKLAVSTAGWTHAADGSWTKAGTYGTATLNSTTGDVAYVLDAGKPGPAAGVVAADTFEVSVDDGHGGTASGTASFAVVGASLPVVTAPLPVVPAPLPVVTPDLPPSIAFSLASVTAAGATGIATATAHATMADPDGDQVSVSTGGWTHAADGSWTKAGVYGTATLDTTTGDVAYTLDPASKPGHGTLASDAFTVTVSDGHGGVTTGTASFAVNGPDQAPNVAFSAAAVVAGGLANATAHATLSDPDGDAFSVSTTGWAHAADGTWTKAGLYGTAALNTITGDIAYTLDPAKTGPVHGAQATDSFALTVIDSHGASTTGNAIFSVGGPETAPSIDFGTADVTLAGATGVANATAHASLSDLDHDTVSVLTSGWAQGPGHTWTKVGALGTATLNAATGDVSYVLDPMAKGPAHDKTAIDSFDVTVSDGHGATSVGHAVFTVHGADAAPTISYVTANVAAGTLSATTVHAAIADADHDAIAVSTDGWTQTTTGGPFTKDGVFGTATLDTKTGDVSYALDAHKTGPSAGASIADNFEVDVSDGHGGTAAGTASFLVAGPATLQTFIGTPFADTFTINFGDNKITGNGGSDTFVFRASAGNTEITDFHTGHGSSQDSLDLSAFHFHDYGALMSRTSDIGGNVAIQLDANSTLTLDHVAKVDLHANLFHL